MTHVGAAATAWADQSANGFNFSSASQSIFTASGINSLPSLGSLSVGSTTVMTSAANANVIFPGTTAAEIFFVAQGSTTTGTNFGSGLGTYTGDATGLFLPFSDGKMYLDFFSSARPSATFTTTTPHLINIIATAAEWTVNVDNVQVLTTTNATPGMPASPITLLGVSSNKWFGWLSAVLGYGAKLSTVNRAAVHTWAQGKYGTP